MVLRLFLYALQPIYASTEGTNPLQHTDRIKESKDLWEVFDEAKAAVLAFAYDKEDIIFILLEELESKETDSEENDSKEIDSKENDSKENDSKENDSKEIDSKENDSKLKELVGLRLDHIITLIDTLELLRNCKSEDYESISVTRMDLIKLSIQSYRDKYVDIYSSSAALFNMERGRVFLKELKEKMQKPEDYTKQLSTIDYRFVYEVKSIASLAEPFITDKIFATKFGILLEVFEEFQPKFQRIDDFMWRHRDLINEYIQNLWKK